MCAQFDIIVTPYTPIKIFQRITSKSYLNKNHPNNGMRRTLVKTIIDHNEGN